MSQRTVLITDFFSASRSTTVSNSTLLQKPIKVIQVEQQPIIKHELFEANFDQCTPTSIRKHLFVDTEQIRRISSSNAGKSSINQIGRNGTR
jgi:hypothetical protein